MNLDRKLKEKRYEEIWQEYCGFLDLTIDEFMDIQKRLLMEQIGLYGNCELGRRIMGDHLPETVEAFRRTVPLTTYDNYADLLLAKAENAMPSKPLLWIQTTWEGGTNPIKLAPYTESMIQCHKGTFITCMILATSRKRGEFSLRSGEKFLYGMAPLPYLTGIVPHMISDELTVHFLPPTKEAEAMSFGQRNKVGMKMGLSQGVDLFFGLSSVIMVISRLLAEKKNSSEKTGFWGRSPRATFRLLRGWLRSRKQKRGILPKDLWQLKGLICAGTDTASFKPQIEAYWGIRPLEIFGGTEPTCIASETWARDGLVFFPDVCFYEFIPRSEMDRDFQDPDYIPRTYLMDELRAGEEYELVISSLKGGAFARYRVGDVFRCLRVKNPEQGVMLPHFTYVDRDPHVIDISGFTRISEKTILKAFELSRLQIGEWFAVKDFDEQDRSFFHLYLELHEESNSYAVSREIIKDHLAIYFRYVDADYKDLKALLGIDPLVVTILPGGTIKRYRLKFNRKLRRMNPSHFDVIEINKLANDSL
ncbi:GH3 family domain-containing protein [Anoxynatronum buryatiense]|uniref:GH3 auxin-responsive promoter n=1 Tax=Anoxynatronum buryatiense TaxID=489973 RepID=A0AA46AJI0_9CLOT|nr:GH3 auxin-responsive promoter family protein [Anoxynatronum buryatiense]SMP61463.1 GH3 auxin-responsive promoter [Anoxynatronum buryatiense]